MPEPSNPHTKLFTGIGWTGLSHALTNAIKLITKLILVRLLTPNDFGLLALGTFVLSIASLFQGGGMQLPLVNARRAEHEIQPWLNTAQLIQVLLATVMTLLLYGSSTYIANYYQAPSLVPLLQVFALCTLLSGFTVVPIGILLRKLHFKELMIAEVASLLIYGVCAVALSFSHYGALGIAYAQAASTLVFTIVLMCYCIRSQVWIPSLHFDFSSLASLLSFGGIVLFNQLLAIGITQGDNAFVGKLAGIEELGVYSMAYFLGTLAGMTLGMIAGRVTYPLYCQHRDETETLRQLYLTVFSASLLFILPLTAAMILFPERITTLALSKKWLTCAPLLPTLAICGFFRFWNMLASTGIEIYGKKGSLTTIGVKTLQILIMGPLVYFGYRWHQIAGVAYAVTIVMTAGALLTTRLVHQKFRVKPKHLIQSFLKPLALSIITGLGVMIFKHPLLILFFLIFIFAIALFFANAQRKTMLVH